MAFGPGVKGKNLTSRGMSVVGYVSVLSILVKMGHFSLKYSFFFFFLSDTWRTPIFPHFFFIDFWAQIHKKNKKTRPRYKNLTYLFMGDVLAPLILAEDTTTSTIALAATWVMIHPLLHHASTLPLWPFGPFMPFSAYSFAAYGHSVSDIHLNTVQPSGGLATQVFALLGLI